MSVCDSVPHVDFSISQSNFTEVGVKFMPLDNTKKLYLLKSKLFIPCLVFADVKMFCTLLLPQDKDNLQ